MLQMLLQQRADYLLLSEGEALDLIAGSERQSSEFRMTNFAEGIKEDTRHFWCARQISDHLIRKLNTALQKNVSGRTTNHRHHR